MATRAVSAKPAQPTGLSPLQHVGIGAISSIVEVTLCQPCVAWKNALQENRPLNVRPSALYRGYFMNVGSIVPVTCVQFGATRVMELALSGEGKPLSSGQRVGVAALAGSCSALISAPTEMVIIHQQKSCAALVPTAQQLLRDHGSKVFTRGLPPCMAREAIYTAGYLGSTPVVKEHLMKLKVFEEQPRAALLAGGIVSGVTASVLTQPFDTVKTRMQANIGDVDGPYSTFARGARTLIAEGGVGRLWAGLFPRGLRIVCATLILSNLREKVTEVFEGGLGVEGGAQAAAGGAVEEGAGSAAAAARSRAGAQRAAAQL